MLKGEIKKIFQSKRFVKVKQIAIKKKIKFDMKTKWNQMLRDKIEKQIQLREGFKTKQIAIKRIIIKSSKWKKLKDDEIENKF
jgi:hypothetical protein